MVASVTIGEMLDITAPDVVQVQIRHDSKVIWINMDGKYVFRACRIGELDIVDDRKECL